MGVGIYKQKAADIMSPHVDSIHSGETVRDALILMAKNRLAVLPVVDSHDHCVGILSQTDLIAFAQDADEEDEFERLQRPDHLGLPIDQVTGTRIEDTMTDDVITARVDQEVVNIADLMLEHGIHHVPVVDEEGVLKGIVYTPDILPGLRKSS